MKIKSEEGVVQGKERRARGAQDALFSLITREKR